jgi:predicted nucleotidyltransferase
MISDVEAHREEIGALCRRYGLERLEVFGSAATGEFDEESSDVDFVVLFSDDVRRSPGYADTYLGLAWDLEDLLGRDVDLVTEQSVSNPYFWTSVNDSRELVYDQRNPFSDVGLV